MNLEGAMDHGGAPSALAAWCLGLVLLIPPAAACELSEPETGTVAAVIDGETLKLSDGRSCG